MKNLQTMVFFALIFFSTIIGAAESRAQAPDWRWARSAGGSKFDEGRSIASDAAGNIYVAGSFYSPSITFGTTTLTNAKADSADMYIVKYDPDGNVLWAQSAGGGRDDRALGIAVDGGGNVLVTGFFKSRSLSFGATTLQKGQPDSENQYVQGDIFIVKYSSEGAVTWAKAIGGNSYNLGSRIIGNSDDVANSIAVDPGGNIVITGYFRSHSITFGATTMTNAYIDTLYAYSHDVFTAKFDSDGNTLWAKSANGFAVDEGRSIVTDPNGNVYVMGYYRSMSFIVGATTLERAPTATADLFLIKYDPAGNIVWAKAAHGTSDDMGRRIVTDGNGNIYVAGSFLGSSITFGTTTLTNADPNTTIDGRFTYDVFLAKYDANGDVVWARSAGEKEMDDMSSIVIDNSGNINVMGSFQSSLLTFGTTTLTNMSADSGKDDTFIVQYDTNGNVLKAQSFGGDDIDRGIAMIADAGSNLYVTGYFYSPSMTVGTTTLTNAGDFDMFIAKLGNGVTSVTEETGNAKSFRIFPNPTAGILALQLNHFKNSEIRSIRVYNSPGMLLKTIPAEFLKESSISIDCSDLNTGIYVVEVFGDTGITARKQFVIAR